MSGADTTSRDPWHALADHTAARIALGRTGASLPTARVLEFALAHARARDAVRTPLDRADLARRIEELGLAAIAVASRAGSRADYLKRPDLGRRLCEESLTRIASENRPCDIALVVADGLSSRAVAAHAAPFLAALLPGLKRLALTFSPVSVVENGRVAIGDEIGAALSARLTVMLIGERPGLSAPDSLGCYLTFGPRIGRADSERNCISNIRDAGLEPPRAAASALWLVEAALKRGLTGVGLKDESGGLPDMAGRRTIDAPFAP